ncbi:hypothetical protein [Nonomuraea dietziae]|uniref:hypothetical protein n=1 Tax=Nonomuraea dietziae TaxID=65515 RepID=UPI0033ED1877
MSLAYSHTSGMPLTPIRDMLEKHVAAPSAVLTRVSLIDINRDNGVYQWRLLRRVPLGAAAAAGG